MNQVLIIQSRRVIKASQQNHLTQKTHHYPNFKKLKETNLFRIYAVLTP